MKEECIYLHKLCEADCDKYVCRAFFPERQPIVQPSMLHLCKDKEYAESCPQRVAGDLWREEKRIKGLTEKCPFASNTRCGRPWEWWCKGGDAPFILTTYEVKHEGSDIPARNPDGSIKFIRSAEDIYETCLSGNAEIYTKCPEYIAGVKFREEYNRLKGKEA